MDMDRVRQAAELAVMKISDAERNEVIDRLKAAYTANQITREQFDKRSTTALKARTELQLRRVTWDLRELPDDRLPELTPAARSEAERLSEHYARTRLAEQSFERGVKRGTISGAALVGALGCWAGVIWAAVAAASQWWALLIPAGIVLLVVSAWFRDELD
jgi:hypothetical protein